MAVTLIPDVERELDPVVRRDHDRAVLHGLSRFQAVLVPFFGEFDPVRRESVVREDRKDRLFDGASGSGKLQGDLKEEVGAEPE